MGTDQTYPMSHQLTDRLSVAVDGVVRAAVGVVLADRAAVEAHVLVDGGEDLLVRDRPLGGVAGGTLAASVAPSATLVLAFFLFFRKFGQTLYDANAGSAWTSNSLAQTS